MALMKLLKMIAILFACVVGASYANAGPHGHHHLHIRDGAAVVTHVVTVPVKMFEYQGQLVPEAEVCQGIMNGTLHWAPGSENTPDCVNFVAASTGAKSTPSTPAVNVVTVTVTLTNTPGAALTTATSVPAVPMTHILTPAASSASSPIVDKPDKSIKLTTLRSITTSVLAMSTSSNEDDTGKTSAPLSGSIHSDSIKASATSSAITSSAIASASAVHSVSSGNSFIQSNTNVDVEFPDGQIDCSEFPDAYGAIHIPWMNLGGWTGIQFAEISESMVMGLSTGVTGNNCTDGNGGSTTFCSYACPPGYQKSQWPTTQGNSSMAVSVGGLKCENGKLHLTNPELSTSLCIAGTGKSFVNNKLNGTASICRTDYPGTEDETIPLQTESGNTYPLTCPDSGSYYQHLGAQTSAEYYVNNKDVPVDVACQWDTDGSDEGNWAPVVIGTETDSSGATWLSIMTSRQNNPTNYKELDFSIELVGDFGGAACFYTQNNGVGYYCTTGKLADFNPDQEGCKSFNPSAGVTVPGCTVQLFSGTGSYDLVETA